MKEINYEKIKRQIPHNINIESIFYYFIRCISQ